MNIMTKRILAFFVDNLIVVFIFSLLNSLFNLEYNTYDFEMFNNIWKVKVTPIILFYLIYFILSDLLNKGITLGKFLFRIKVNASEKKLIKRSIIKTLSYLILPITLIFWIVMNKLPQDYFLNIKTENIK
ncbi:MAG: hypothetical protein GKR88_09860 [Flavobacteriaceae bacterium]|nr:MAG: hypothetical protein GKR88_05670 [Flavobacteriaceae bacterium]QMU64249.1 MAG: hypothetical protein GKR88_08055 [Flavobacteriaceae bacterium]QMU64556.1 MAG: hypothetical protein GKR88_09860 [Flavobacteriaceae bacterium]